MKGFKQSEVEAIVSIVQTWARSRSEIDAVALVGSWARKQAHENSDIDLMLLTSNPDLFFNDSDWLDNLPWNDLNLQLSHYYDRAYGVVRSHHLCFQKGQRIEFIPFLKSNKRDRRTNCNQ